MALFSAATISSDTGTVAWSTEQPFNGYLLLTMTLPAGYTTVRKAGFNPAQVLPQIIRIPIADGVIHAASQVPFTTTLEPPGVTYTYAFYDSNNQLIAAGDAPITVTSTPTSISVPTLTVPS